ncbi:MAG: hypothetical protein K2Y05_01985, partial [Hyphomicrobiaceae bacterium]|nr:hypothetical protein [Hyphomicrobiaceae bacterium]
WPHDHSQAAARLVPVLTERGLMAGRAASAPLTRRQALAALAAGAAWCVAPIARAAAEPTWVDQRRLGPFICRSAFPLDSALLADADLASLELELRRVLALAPCQAQIEVLLLNDAQQHRRLIAERHPSAPYRRALSDVTDVQDTIAHHGAEVVLHGHNHDVSEEDISSARVFGIGSASAQYPYKGEHRACWQLIRVTPRTGGGFHITREIRGLPDYGETIRSLSTASFDAALPVKR